MHRAMVGGAMGPLQPIHLAGPAPNTSTDRAGPRPRHSIRWSSHHLETFLAQATETDPMGYGVPFMGGEGPACR